MTEPTTTTDILTVVYGLALCAGLLYALFLIFFQGLGHAFHITIFDLHMHPGSIFDMPHPDIHPGTHLDAHDGDLTGLSMLALTGFVTAFGAFGLAASMTFKVPPIISLLFAILGGFIVGAAAQVVFIRALSQTTSSNIQIETLKGINANVTVSIIGNGMGQIALVHGGQRLTLIARSSAATDIKRGSTVIVDSVQNGVAFVSLPQEYDDSLSNTDDR